MSFTNAKVVGKAINPAEYHQQTADRGSHGFVISSSSLREFLTCASRWREGYQSPDSEAKAWGSLLDCRHLTPDQFDSRYAVKPATYTNEKGEEKPWNANSHTCRAWLAERDGIEIVSAAEVTEADAAIARLMAHDIIRAWREASDTQVWLSADWTDVPTGLVIPCRCLIDYVPRADTEFAKCAGDLKTTRSAGRKAFDRQCFQRGWHVQAAFDLDMLAAATGEDRNTWCFIVQENYAPWQPACRMLAQGFLQIGRQTYQAALDRYARCLSANHWPDYDDHEDAIDGWSLVEPEPWMEFEAVSEAMRGQQTRLMETASPEPDDLIP